MNTLAAISSILIATAAKATLVFVLAWGAALLLRKLSAATRHMLLVFAIVAALLLPFSALLPQWRVSGIPDFTEHLAPVRDTASLRATAPSDGGAASESDPIPVTPHGRTPRRVPQVSDSQRSRTHSRRTAGEVQLSETAVAPQASTVVSASIAPQHRSGIAWPLLLILIWTLGTVVFLARAINSRSHLRGLVRRAALLADSGWNAQVRAAAAMMGISRHVALLVSGETGIPLTTGILFPAVVLPLEYCEWSPLRREAVLLHELAHIQRLDALTQLLAEIAAALYWWNPLVWLIARDMRVYRERACDDTVLASGTRASDYAHELLDIVSTLQTPELRSALAMARRSQLEGRILAVLNPALSRGSVSRTAAMMAAGLTLAIVIPLAAMGPAQDASTPTTPTARTSQGKPSPDATAPTAAPVQPFTNSSADQEIVGTPEPPEPPEPAEAPEAPEPPSTPAAFGTQSVPAARSTPAAPAAPAAPVAPAAPAAPSGPGGMDIGSCGRVRTHSTNIEDNGSRRTWKASWSGDNCDVSLHAEGDIRFNAEATAIESISSGGYFEVNEHINDTLRQIRVTPSNSGLDYVYRINGKQQPFDAQARTWFSAFLLTLERTTGFNADARVAQLMAKGGPVAVLNEIGNLTSDYVRSLYFRKLLEHPNLPAPIVLRIMNQAGQQISNDYELARVLMSVSRQYDLPDEPSRTAFLNASNKLKNDYEHSRVLIALLRRPNLSAANVQVALNSAAMIKNDYEKSRLALALIGQKSFSSNEVPAFLKLVSSNHSDYEKSRDLIAVLQRYQLPPAAVNQILDAAAAMTADYEKSRLLTALAGKGKFDESQMTSYLKVVDSMKADYERARSLIALMGNNTLSPASVSRIVKSVAGMRTDYEKSRILVSLVDGNKFSESAISDFLNAVDSMKTDYERSRSLTALINHEKLSENSLGGVFDNVTGIGNDYEKARVLTEVAGAYHLEGPLRDRYIQAAQTIHSDFERNRALNAVARRASL